MPDPDRTREVLAALRQAAPGALVMWRGPEVGGGDVDLVVRPGRDSEVLEALGALGLAPWPAQPGQTTWRLPGEVVVLDVWSAWTWPGSYPGLAGLLERARLGEGELPVAAPEDRLLVFAVDAVRGHRLASLRPKVARALAQPGALERARELACGERAAGLLPVVAAPLPDGEALGRRRAMRAGLRSSKGRAALAERVFGPSTPRPPGSTPGQRGRLVTLSGLDGSGKSSAGLALAGELEREGSPAVVMWTRLAADLRLLRRLAPAARRILGRERGASSAVDVGAAVAQRAAPAAAPPRRPSPLGSTWATLVALSYVRQCRRLMRVRRNGVHLVCDRWLVDALVDLRLRYGRHLVAEWVLRTGMPRPDLAVLLAVSPGVAAQRKPGDQEPETLRLMHEMYTAAAPRHGLVLVDADQPAAAVRDAVVQLLKR